MAMLKRLFIFLIIIVVLALLSIYWPQLTGNVTNNQQQTSYQRESALVTKIVDGDTIKAEIDRTEYSIRLLGINTPEKNKPYYKEAKGFLLQIENQSVELLRDKEDIDRYDRKLKYVFYENRFINVEILEQGLATSFMTDELKYKDKLLNAENFSRKNEKGLWEKSSELCSPCIKLEELNPVQDYFIIKNNCNFDCNLTAWSVKDDANHFFKIKSLYASETSRYDSKTEIWNDNGDRFFMRDSMGKLAVFYEYG